MNTTPKQSDTPRTDHASEYFSLHGAVELARTLERELTEAQMHLTLMQKEHDIELERATHYREKWQEAHQQIAALQADKERLGENQTKESPMKAPRTDDALEGAIGQQDALNRVTALCYTLEAENAAQEGQS